MVVLTNTINMVLSNYVIHSIKSNLITHNQTLTSFLELSKTPTDAINHIISDDFILISYIYDHNTNQTYTFNNNMLLDINTISKLRDLEENTIIEIELDMKKTFVYTQKTMVDSSEFTVSTIISQADVSILINKITRIVIIIIIIMSFFTILLTQFISNRITSPFKDILKGIHKISKKEFDQDIVVYTNDEFLELAKSINHMSSQLQRLDVEQKKFFEDFSHDLKTPLTIISSYAEALRHGIIQHSDTHCELIINECSLLKKRIENIIYLSKLDTTEDHCHYKRISIDTLLSKSLDHLDSLIIVGELNILYDVPSSIYVEADEEKLMCAFENIFSNAIRHAKETIEICCSITNNTAIITIVDDGDGFSENKLANPFSRHNTSSTSGSGIGLSIIKKIVDLHNGELILSNTTNKGACYQLILPQS